MANIIADPKYFVSTKWGFPLLWKPPMKAVQRPHEDICSPSPECPAWKGGVEWRGEPSDALAKED